MSQAEQAMIRHLSGFFTAFEAFVKEMKPQLEQLKQQLEKTKQ